MLTSALPGAAAGRWRTHLLDAGHLTRSVRGEVGGSLGCSCPVIKVWVERAPVLFFSVRTRESEMREEVLCSPGAFDWKLSSFTRKCAAAPVEQ